MFYMLQTHPDSESTPNSRANSRAPTKIDVETRRQGSLLTLRYVVSCAPSELVIPATVAPRRRDELWQHTCCEAFLGAAGEPAYYEFNFSPSSEWAAYRFSGYRSGRTDAEVKAPDIELEVKGDRLALSATVDMASLQLNGNLRIALTAVIETRSGQKSYWALAHAPGKPDFHHTHGFIELADSSS